MPRLRHAHHLGHLGHIGRLVLLWFALSLGVAVASPIVNPQAVELVCSSAGAVKMVVQTDDGAQELGMSHMDCPLCTPPGAPRRGRVVALPRPVPGAPGVPPIRAARIAAATAAPLPARGPPAL